MKPSPPRDCKANLSLACHCSISLREGRKLAARAIQFHRSSESSPSQETGEVCSQRSFIVLVNLYSPAREGAEEP